MYGSMTRPTRFSNLGGRDVQRFAHLDFRTKLRSQAKVRFTPTVPTCSVATLIGLTIKAVSPIGPPHLNNPKLYEPPESPAIEMVTM